MPPEDQDVNKQILEKMEQIENKLAEIPAIKKDLTELMNNIPLLAYAVEDHEFKQAVKKKSDRIKASAKRLLRG